MQHTLDPRPTKGQNPSFIMMGLLEEYNVWLKWFKIVENRSPFKLIIESSNIPRNNFYNSSHK